jgi:TRAP-type C4-dicarboxylate transport system permease small subunit
MVLSMLPRKLRFLCMTVTSLLSAAIAFFIIYAAIRQARTALASNYVTSVLSITLYPFYWVEAATMSVFLVTLLFDALKNFCAVFDDDVAREIQATWSV